MAYPLEIYSEICPWILALILLILALLYILIGQVVIVLIVKLIGLLYNLLWVGPNDVMTLACGFHCNEERHLTDFTSIDNALGVPIQSHNLVMENLLSITSACQLF